MDVGNFVGVLGFVVAVAASLGAAVAVFRANLAKATIEGQAHRIDTLEGELSDERRAREHAEERLAHAEARIAEQQAEITTLARLKTGEQAVAELTRQLVEHHDLTMAALASIEARP